MHKVIPEASELIQLEAHLLIQEAQLFQSAAGRHGGSTVVRIWRSRSHQVLKFDPLREEEPHLAVRRRVWQCLFASGRIDFCSNGAVGLVARFVLGKQCVDDLLSERPSLEISMQRLQVRLKVARSIQPEADQQLEEKICSTKTSICHGLVVSY